jgi:hypothetical protein
MARASLLLTVLSLLIAAPVQSADRTVIGEVFSKSN